MANFDFWGYQICQQTVQKINKFHSHFQLKSKRKERNNEFWRAINSDISDELSTNRNKLNTAFDKGFYSKWEGLRRSEWRHCLSHKDLIIKSVKTNYYCVGLVLFFENCFEILN